MIINVSKNVIKCSCTVSTPINSSVYRKSTSLDLEPIEHFLTSFHSSLLVQLLEA